MNILPIATDRSYYLTTKYNNDSSLYFYQKNFIDYVANNHDNQKMYLLMFEAGTGKTLAYLKLCERLIINGVYKRVFIITRTVLFHSIKAHIPASIESTVHCYTFITFTQELMNMDINTLTNNTIIIFDEIQIALGDQDAETKDTSQTRLFDFRAMCTKLYMHIAYNKTRTLTIFSTATLMINTSDNALNFVNVFYKYKIILNCWYDYFRNIYPELPDEEVMKIAERAINDNIGSYNNDINIATNKINNKLNYYNSMLNNYSRIYSIKCKEYDDLYNQYNNYTDQDTINKINSKLYDLDILKTKIKDNYNNISYYINQLVYIKNNNMSLSSLNQLMPLVLNDISIDDMYIEDNDNFDINDISDTKQIKINKNKKYGLSDDKDTDIPTNKTKNTIMNIPDDLLSEYYIIKDIDQAAEFIVKHTSIFTYKNPNDIIDRYIVNPYISYYKNPVFSQEHISELDKCMIIPLSLIQSKRNINDYSYIKNLLIQYGIQPDDSLHEQFSSKNQIKFKNIDKKSPFQHNENLILFKLFHSSYEYQLIDRLLAIFKLNNENINIRTYICVSCDIIAKVNPMIAFILQQVLLAFYDKEPGMSIVYFEDQVQHGMKEFALCLELINKYSPRSDLLSLIDITKSDVVIESAFKYCLVDGKSCQYYNNNQRDKFNSESNVNGSLCNLVIFSKVFREGVSFSNVLRKFYPVFSWNKTTKYQVEHRTLRSDSFKHFTPNILSSQRMKKYLDENGRIYPHNYTIMYSDLKATDTYNYIDYDYMYFDNHLQSIYIDYNHTMVREDTDRYTMISFSDIFDIWNDKNILKNCINKLYIPIYMDILNLYVEKQFKIDYVNNILYNNSNKCLVKDEDTSTDKLAYNIFDLMSNINNDDVNLIYLQKMITGLNCIPNYDEYNAHKTSDFTVMPCINICGNISSKTKIPTISKTNAICYRSINQVK